LTSLLPISLLRMQPFGRNGVENRHFGRKNYYSSLVR
jgi:hypothetical protein